MIYQMFIRSIMEYNSVSWMGAAKSHLDKLDRIQASAEKIGGFTAEPLQARRDAAAMSLALKMLDGRARGELATFKPTLCEPLRLCKKRTRQSLEGTQVVQKVRSKSLDVYKRGFFGVLPQIWSRIPKRIVQRGERVGWLKIKSACTKFLTNQTAQESDDFKKLKVNDNPETDLDMGWIAIVCFNTRNHYN